MRCALTYCWYALACKQNKENVMSQKLEAKGFEVFYPRILMSDCASKTMKVKPFFPGYIFVRFDASLTSLSTFQWMENSEGIVCLGGKPSFVPDRMVQSIQARLDHLNADRLFFNAKEREDEIIDSSYPSSFESLFDARISDEARVSALVKMIQAEIDEPGEALLTEQNQPD
jgi:transcription antitermination factor NusG